MSNISLILLAFFLIFLNAFFVAAEFAMVKLRHTQVKMLEEDYSVRGYILATVHKHLDAYLSACQLGITLASLGLGWIGEPAFAYWLEPVFRFLDITSPNLVKIMAFFTAFVILSFLHIVLGELMPKSLAIRQPASVSLWTAAPLYVFYWVMYPAIWLLNTCSNLMLKLTKLDTTQHNEHFYSTEEIKLILTASYLHGELTQEETKIIERTLDLADLKVTEVMRSPEEMVTLELQRPIPQLLQTVLAHRYSRYPIYDRDKQEMVGILHIKDLFPNLYHQDKIANLKPFIRPVLKVSSQLPALSLLQKFRKGTSHFCLVYRDKSTLIGFITLDNLLQILIGRIKDEFHKTKTDCIKNSDGSFTARGDCSIYSLEKALNRKINLLEKDNEVEIHTLTGLIFHQLGAFPEEGQKIEFAEFDAIVEEIEGTRLQTVTIYPKD